MNCKPSTYAEYQWSIEHVLVPEFGVLPLDKLSIDHVRKLIAKYIEKGRSKATIQTISPPLRAAYTQAMDDDLVTKNPAARLGKLLKKMLRIQRRR